MDDVRLYNRALSLAEIQALANPGPATLSSIAVTPANPIIAAGLTQQFTATGTYSDASTAEPHRLGHLGLGDARVATINSTGLATGVAAGTAPSARPRAWSAAAPT